MHRLRLVPLALLVLGLEGGAADEPLRLSVYATAGDVSAHLGTATNRAQVATLLGPLQVTRLFLEGRRGDEYVSPALLREVREDFGRRGIACAGGIATVPGTDFGARQNEPLTWLNWESEKTRRDVAAFFTENAPVFEEMIVDDFFCTADTSPASEQARGGRPWSVYRRDLLVSLIAPLMLEPARQARPGVRLIIKFPQWYDRFHLFGYDPPRMAQPFDQVWVGTEVRNPQTRRMGFVQPTEGYVNFRWLTSVAGAKVVGAWFDHIECTPENFVDQAFQSVLAGARELTLFHLGDLVAGHPGDALLARRLPELQELARKARGKSPAGIACYKPPGSDAADNLYLMDYLAMLGLPIVPCAEYPGAARVAVLPAQAAADPQVLERMRAHLDRGSTVVVTPAFLRAVGSEAQALAGVDIGAAAQPAAVNELAFGRRTVALSTPLEVDAGVTARGARVVATASVARRQVPWLTRHRQDGKRMLVLNVRTFSEADFAGTGEWLLAPKPLGLPSLPADAADALREALLRPLGLRFSGPAGVGLYGFGGSHCLYNFADHPVRVRFNGRPLELPAHGWRWIE